MRELENTQTQAVQPIGGVNLFKKYATDTNKESVDGAKFIIDEASDCYIRVKRWTGRNIAHSKAQAKITTDFADNLDDPAVNELRNQAFIEHLIVGWNNVADENGNLLPFTTENAKRLLGALPDLVDQLALFAMERENYALQEVVKN